MQDNGLRSKGGRGRHFSQKLGEGSQRRLHPFLTAPAPTPHPAMATPFPNTPCGCLRASRCMSC